MTEQEKKLAFVSFCIEEYKTEHHVSGSMVADAFSVYGVIDYLLQHYDILHSMGRNEILNDIERYLEVRRRQK